MRKYPNFNVIKATETWLKPQIDTQCAFVAPVQFDTNLDYQTKMKFALVSNVLPPSETGHAMIIYRLLRDLHPDDYCLISSKDYAITDGPEYSAKLPGRYYHLPAPFQLTRGTRFGLQAARKWINIILGILLRALGIARILRREKCSAIIVCTGGHEVLDMPAAYAASRMAGARFYPYLLDQYIHMVEFVLGKHFIGRIEPFLLKRAAAVIAPNEFLRDELNRRYGIDAKVIHNPCDLSDYKDDLNLSVHGAAESGEGPRAVVYTGSVGNLHFDALRNLVTAIRSLKHRKIKLHLYTAQAPELIQQERISGPVVFHEHQSNSAMPAIQRRADVLFLPLAFASPYPEIVRTAAPGKMGEFLAARRPVLVHAPADSFIAWYFRKYECGLVVDDDDPEALARALATILDDMPLREKLSANAWRRAVEDFSLATARAQFIHLLRLQGSGLRSGH